MDFSRRSFLSGIGALFCAPAIVRVASLMPVKFMPPELTVGNVPIDLEMMMLGRRAFVPKWVVQIYQSSPSLNLLSREA